MGAQLAYWSREGPRKVLEAPAGGNGPGTRLRFDPTRRLGFGAQLVQIAAGGIERAPRLWAQLAPSPVALKEHSSRQRFVAVSRNRSLHTSKQPKETVHAGAGSSGVQGPRRGLAGRSRKR